MKFDCMYKYLFHYYGRMIRQRLKLDLFIVEAVDHHTQFNTRLSSSTPDPDRLFVDIDQQMIPERDTSSPLWKTVLASQNVAANKGRAFSVRSYFTKCLNEADLDKCRVHYKSLYYRSRTLKYNVS